MGLGRAQRNNPQAAGQCLAAARKAAQEARNLLRIGKDPVETKRAARAALQAEVAAKKAETAKTHLTLARASRAYHEAIIEPTRSSKHAAQWIASLERNVPKELWERPIAKVTAPALFDALRALQARIPETASRVRQRLEAIFEDAQFRGQCSENPARAIRRKLHEAQPNVKKSHFASLPYAEAPTFIARLRKEEGNAARALELAMLTGARTSEVLNATWDEFDLVSGVWTIPAERMKAREKHLVYLSPAALLVCESMTGLSETYVFPSPLTSEKPLSNMAMLCLLRRMKVEDRTTVHGLCRSTFSTWANETAAARPDVIEACLAHREADLVRRAYNRSDFASERRKLLVQWADYLESNISEAATAQPAANADRMIPAAQLAASFGVCVGDRPTPV
jgi:integrase